MDIPIFAGSCKFRPAVVEYICSKTDLFGQLSNKSLTFPDRDSANCHGLFLRPQYLVVKY